MIIEASFRVVTPLFLGGAGQEAELRLPSIKGALRFWYRATVLARLKSWQEVQKAEKKLFGSTDTTQGLFLAALKESQVEVVAKGGQKWLPPEGKNQFGSIYLLGMGLYNMKKGLTRDYLKDGGRFKLRLFSRPGIKVEESEVGDILRALKAWALFGGLGSRSRHGFGSLCLESLHCEGKALWQPPQNLLELQERIGELLSELGELPEELPEYTAFSKQSRVTIALTASDAFKVLEAVGREIMRYRSYGRKPKNGSINAGHQLPWGEKVEQIFRDDHDLVASLIMGKHIEKHPRRVVFGLPHNYYFSSLKANVEIQGEDQDSPRRASPLFIHVHPLTNECAAILTFMPARFFPEGGKVKMSVKKGYEVGNSKVVPCKVDYQVVHDLLDRFSQRVEVPIA